MPQVANGIHGAADSAPQPLVSQTSAPPVEGISAESIHNIQSNSQSQQSGVLQPTLAADATCIITTVQSKTHDSPSEDPPESCLEKQVPAVSDVAPAVSVPSQPPSAPSYPPVENSISPPPPTLSETSAATLPQPEESMQARAGTTAPPSSDPSSSHASAASSAAVSAPSSPGPSLTPPVARRPQNAFGNRLSLALGPTARRVILPAKPVPRSRAASPAAPARQDIAPVPGSTGGQEEASATAVAAAASEAMSSAPELEQSAVDIVHNGTTADDHCTADAEEDKLLISDTATQSPGVLDTQQPASTEAASDFSHPDSAQEAQQQSAASTASGSESLPSSPVPVRREAQTPSRLPAEAPEGIWAAPDINTAPTAEVHSAAEDSADELISPKATAPVRKPPGLPSPVPSTHGRIDTEPAAINGMPSWADPEFDEDHASWAEQDPIDDSSAWAEQDPIDDSSVWAEPAAVDDNSSWPEPAHVNGMSAWVKPAANSIWAEQGQTKASSQLHSPIKADEASTTSSQTGQEAPMASETRTEEQKLKREETQLEQKLRDELKRIKGNSKPIDPNDAALRARLEKEAKQQFEQEHRHLKGKMRAAEKAAAERISKERLQQEKQEAQHARRRDERIAAAGVAAPSARHHSTGPYHTYPNSNAASSDDGYDAEDVRPHPRHAPKAYLDAEVRHVPAHPLYEERPASNAALREGHVASRTPRAQPPFTRAQTQGIQACILQYSSTDLMKGASATQCLKMLASGNV